MATTKYDKGINVEAYRSWFCDCSGFSTGSYQTVHINSQWRELRIVEISSLIVTQQFYQVIIDNKAETAAVLGDGLVGMFGGWIDLLDQLASRHY